MADISLKSELVARGGVFPVGVASYDGSSDRAHLGPRGESWVWDDAQGRCLDSWELSQVVIQALCLVLL